MKESDVNKAWEGKIDKKEFYISKKANYISYK